MNAEAEYRYRGRKAELAEKGLDAYRRAALQSLRLKTVIKESHGRPCTCLAFNHMDPRCGNLFATVGGTQATVYDDAHLGEFTDIVVAFDNQPGDHTDGGELGACAWLDTSLSKRPEQRRDAWLAVAGKDYNISVISVLESRVLYLLKGHDREVVQLAGVPSRPCSVVSLAKGGNLRVWHVLSEACVASYSSDVTCLAVHLEGQWMAVWGKSGGLRRVDLPPLKTAGGTVQGPKTSGVTGPPICTESAESSCPLGSVSKALEAGQEGGRLEGLECLLFLDRTRLLAKTGDGRVTVWDWQSNDSLASWKVRGHRANDPLRIVGATSDGTYACSGNSDGEVMVYDAATGQSLCTLLPIKVTGPVRACGISEDCRHVLALIGNGFIFRWEAQDSADGNPTAMEEENPTEEETPMEEGRPCRRGCSREP
eukprot:jgi/Botrbrau1/10566/Bobra.0343s0014.1